MRVLVCGGRDYANYEHVWTALSRLPKGTTIVHGAARGADSLAAHAAKMRKIPVLAFPADWDRYKRAAGPIRNHLMLIEGKPNVVLAFHKDLDSSKGTKDMVTKAIAAGIPVRLITC